MNRYSVPIVRTDSINYSEDPVFAPVRMFATHFVLGYRSQNGSWDGIYGVGARELVARIGDQMPFVSDMFRRQHRGKNNMPETLVRRGIFGVPRSEHKHGNNELASLLHMVETYRFIDELVRQPRRTITVDHLMECQQRLLLMESMPGPHVYRRTNLSMPRHIYFGSSGSDPNVRNSGHSNSPLFLSRVWSVATAGIARDIENKGLDFLRENCAYSLTERGGFVMPWDNPERKLDEFMERYDFLFHNSAQMTCDTAHPIHAAGTQLQLI